MDAGEVVAALVGQVADGLEVELNGDRDFFAAACTRNLGGLAVDVAFVLALDLDLLGDGAGQGKGRRSEGGDSIVDDAGALQQVGERDALGDGLEAVRGKTRVVGAADAGCLKPLRFGGDGVALPGE